MHVEKIGSATLYLADSLEVLHHLSPGFTGLLTDPPYSSGGLTASDRKASSALKYCAGPAGTSAFTGDNKDQRSFSLWSCLWMGIARELCQPGAMAAIFTDWRQIPATTDALQGAGWVWRGLGTWDKTAGVRPNRGAFRHQCEFFGWGTNGPRKHEGISLPGYFRASPLSEKKHHIAGKPVAIAEALLPVLGNNILDPFMGSGTVGVACARQGLAYTGIEIDTAAFETACKRIWEANQAMGQ